MNRSEELIACLEGEIVRRDARIAELTAAYTSELNELANRNYALRTENGQLHTELAALREQVPVATKLLPDVYDERDGPWFSNADIKRLSDLPAGTKLYTGPVAIAAIAERDARIAELELSEKRIYSEMLEANNSFARMFQAGAIKLTEERDQLREELAALRERGVEAPEGWTIMPNGGKSMRISHCGVGMSFNEDEPDRRIVWLVDFLRALYAAPVARPRVLPEREGGHAQKSFWAGFEVARMRPDESNIRAAWNEFKSSEQFARISAADQEGGV